MSIIEQPKFTIAHNRTPRGQLSLIYEGVTYTGDNTQNIDLYTNLVVGDKGTLFLFNPSNMNFIRFDVRNELDAIIEQLTFGNVHRATDVFNFLYLIKKDINDLLKELLMAKNYNSIEAIRVIIDVMKISDYPIVISNTIYPQAVFMIILNGSGFDDIKCRDACRNSMTVIWESLSRDDKKSVQHELNNMIIKSSQILSSTNLNRDTVIANIVFLNKFVI